MISTKIVTGPKTDKNRERAKVEKKVGTKVGTRAGTRAGTIGGTMGGTKVVTKVGTNKGRDEGRDEDEDEKQCDCSMRTARGVSIRCVSECTRCGRVTTSSVLPRGIPEYHGARLVSP